MKKVSTAGAAQGQNVSQGRAIGLDLGDRNSW